MDIFYTETSAPARQTRHERIREEPRAGLFGNRRRKAQRADRSVPLHRDDDEGPDLIDQLASPGKVLPLSAPVTPEGYPTCGGSGGGGGVPVPMPSTEPVEPPSRG